MSGDLILVNGQILTMDPARPRATALAIRQGRIVAVGDEDDVRSSAGAGVETPDELSALAFGDIPQLLRRDS